MLLFSIPLAAESQDQFVFAWERQQWTFQEMVALDFSLFSFPTSVKWAYYIDNITLTCEELSLLQDTLQTWLEHLQARR